jgi:HAD superfamily hydrolase (TIGR01549 family)
LQESVEAGESMPIRGVVFDLDGTLVAQEIDFEAIRRELGVPSGTPLLELLHQLPEPRRSAAWEIVDRHERNAAARTELQLGVAEFLAWLDARQIRRAVLSRNSRRSVETALQRVGLAFDPVVAREDAPFKPNPQGLWQICEAWQIVPADVLMVGDYIYDLQAGRNAGTKTALVTHGRDWHFAHLADVTFPNFRELPDFGTDWFEK